MIFLAGFFFFGLFKEYAACVYTGILCCFFLVSYRKKEVRIFLGPESVMVFTVTLLYLFSSFWGVDSGMGIIGAARLTGVSVFAALIMQMDALERKELFLCIPAGGIMMTLFGAAAWFFPSLRGFFWTDSRRLGGFFQYPNVFALFCLLGFLVLAEQNRREGGLKKRKIRFAFMAVLLLGILLSGSRSVFFLTAGAVFLAAAFEKRNRKEMAVLFFAALFLAAGYALSSGNMSNIGRFFSSSFSSSTLLGRLIYAQDAFKLLVRHPFGLGYLGYYYMEPEIQTAVYSVRFVHNDILQVALDAGVLPCLFFCGILIKNIFSKRHSFYERLMLAVFGLHLFLDFDLEFISMWYALVLLLDPACGKEVVIRPGKKKKAAVGAVLACGVVSVYFGAAMLPRYLGNPGASLLAMPFYTEAGKEVLAEEEDMDAAVRLADRLLAQNAYIAEAFDIKALEAYREQEYVKMLSFKKKSLALQKYDMAAYERYVALLGQALSDAADRGEEEAVLEILPAIADTEDVLDKVKKQTNPLAYQTRDVPEFMLSSKTTDYIGKVKSVLNSENIR